MAEYIDREKLGICRCNPEVFEGKGYAKGWNAAIDIIQSAPAADVRPVVIGKWIDRDDDYYGWNMWACSACGEEFVLTEGTPDMNEYHFCPNCGAWMGEADETLST